MSDAPKFQAIVYYPSVRHSSGSFGEAMDLVQAASIDELVRAAAQELPEDCEIVDPPSLWIIDAPFTARLRQALPEEIERREVARRAAAEASIERRRVALRKRILELEMGTDLAQLKRELAELEAAGGET